ncbi:MAG: hypothetical protein OXF07_12780 [Rhodobacter sp.]|nr:hypothetical protein [Rhodobacter sp.]MCY4168486.1 hypothetical protein [Rhodobacter sp.]MCY4240481.1 hypothetical protein [Rhodobacter sp.]
MISVDAFYAWALPETMTGPTARGLLAEYLVRRAVGETTHPAEDWCLRRILCGYDADRAGDAAAARHPPEPPAAARGE